MKTPERIEALGYVLLIALFIYMTLEERIRNGPEAERSQAQQLFDPL